MENKIRLKIVSSWISTSKDYLEIVRLKKEIAETIKQYVENLLGEDTLNLIGEARSMNPECILDQEDIGLGFLGGFKEKYCPHIKNSMYNIIPRYGTYYGRYINIFNSSIVPEIRNLRIDFNYQCPRLFYDTLKSFDNLEVTNKDIYDVLKNMFIQYLTVCNRLGDSIDVMCKALCHKEMTKTRLKKELPKLYELC